MYRNRRRERLWKLTAISAAIIFAVVILWIDIATGLWQEVVILSGLVAGIVMFLLTILVFDRIAERATERRWAPVNRLALSEFLHELADDKKSEISRGIVVPRSFGSLTPETEESSRFAQLHHLRNKVVAERTMLSDSLSRWAEFLNSTGDNDEILLHIADIAMALDEIRDATLDVEKSPNSSSLTAALNAKIDECNTSFARLIGEIQSRIAVLTDEHKTQRV